MNDENSMNDYFMEYIQSIVKSYKKLDMPHKYELSEVIRILREKYLAIEEDISLADLEPDAKVHATKYFVISNPNVLRSLFTNEEKIELYSMVKLLESAPVNFEYEIEKMWNNIQQGRRINVILESEDKKYLNGFTLQGMSERLFNEMMVFKGIDSSECILGEEKFHEYLKALIKAEFIRPQ